MLHVYADVSPSNEFWVNPFKKKEKLYAFKYVLNGDNFDLTIFKRVCHLFLYSLPQICLPIRKLTMNIILYNFSLFAVCHICFFPYTAYGQLGPGMTSHWKFVDDFLKTCSISHLSTHLIYNPFGLGMISFFYSWVASRILHNTQTCNQEYASAFDK